MKRGRSKAAPSPSPMAVYESLVDRGPVLEYALVDSLKVRCRWSTALHHFDLQNLAVSDIFDGFYSAELAGVYKRLCEWRAYSICVSEGNSWLRLKHPTHPHRTILLAGADHVFDPRVKRFFRDCPCQGIGEFMCFFSGSRFHAYPEFEEFFARPDTMMLDQLVERPNPPDDVLATDCLLLSFCGFGCCVASRDGRVFVVPLGDSYYDGGLAFEAHSGWRGYLERFERFLGRDVSWMLPYDP